MTIDREKKGKNENNKCEPSDRMLDYDLSTLADVASVGRKGSWSDRTRRATIF